MKAGERRNLNPTPEAVMAMNLWGSRYAAQRGGCMDFYDSLTPNEKHRCAEAVSRILDAAEYHKQRLQLPD